MSKTLTTLEQMRDLPNEELVAALVRTRDELFRLHLGQHTNQVTSSAGLTTKRRDIARIMTIMRARSLSIETQAQKKTSKKVSKKTPKAKS
jgi:large subunit ribosomal protein L29